MTQENIGGAAARHAAAQKHQAQQKRFEDAHGKRHDIKSTPGHFAFGEIDGGDPALNKGQASSPESIFAQAMPALFPERANQN
jgi:hypothetical protein